MSAASSCANRISAPISAVSPAIRANSVPVLSGAAPGSGRLASTSAFSVCARLFSGWSHLGFGERRRHLIGAGNGGILEIDLTLAGIKNRDTIGLGSLTFSGRTCGWHCLIGCVRPGLCRAEFITPGLRLRSRRTGRALRLRGHFLRFRKVEPEFFHQFRLQLIIHAGCDRGDLGKSLRIISQKGGSGAQQRDRVGIRLGRLLRLPAGGGRAVPACRLALRRGSLGTRPLLPRCPRRCSLRRQ